MADTSATGWWDSIVASLSCEGACLAAREPEDVLPMNPRPSDRRGIAQKDQGRWIDVGSPTSTDDAGGFARFPNEYVASPDGSAMLQTGGGDEAGFADAKTGILRGSFSATSTASGPLAVLKSDQAEALSRRKEVTEQIAALEKQKAKLDPQVEYYLKVANRPDVTISDNHKAMMRVKQLKREQASLSRDVEKLKDVMRQAKDVADKAKVGMRQLSFSKFSSSSFRLKANGDLVKSKSLR
jgi:hypothetical protein